MKLPIIAGLLGAGVLLTGCETTVVERDHHHGYGYRGDSPSVYVDSGERGHYDRGYDHSDYRGSYPTRNVERTNVNISETNVNRTVVNRTNVNQNVKQAPRAGAHSAPQPQAQPPKKGDDKKHAGHDKKKDGDQQQ